MELRKELGSVLMTCCFFAFGTIFVIPSAESLTETDTAIVAGTRVGSLQLGDTIQQAMKVFPRKHGIDQESSFPGCGTEYLWVDLEHQGHGNMFIRSRKGKVFQIDVASSHFHTAEGISTASTPEQVKGAYKGLRAFVLNSPFSEALGGRPMIFWVDQSRGIAFGFASERRNGLRYLYEICVYLANSDFCPLGQRIPSDDWRELTPYSLDLPDTIAKK